MADFSPVLAVFSDADFVVASCGAAALLSFVGIRVYEWYAEAVFWKKQGGKRNWYLKHYGSAYPGLDRMK